MTIFRFSLFTVAATFFLLVTGCAPGPGGGTTPLSNQEPAIAPALAATEVANAVSNVPLTPKENFRLLEQATFGARLEDIENAGKAGPEAWIDAQMQLPATYLSDGLAAGRPDQWNEYVNVWWRHAIKAEDQLRQRVAFALSQILVVSADAGGLGQEQFGLANYYDILLRHAFGNYRDLLQEVTLNPVMGEYLSMKGNQKPDFEKNIQPDENYAREVLQLFSIGQVLLNDDGTPKLDQGGVPLPAYDQTTIENFARVFTGWHFANAEHFIWPQNKDYISAMVPWEDYHDTGSKKLLNGLEIAAGLSARQELTTALDNIFNHPNVGPFISRQLIQRLVTSNPSTQYVQDVANVFNLNHAGERGSLASTIKAILMHSEARRGHLTAPDTFGKLKEPLIRMTQVWRAFEPDVIPSEFNYAWVENELGQAPLHSPSVFNFFRPDYSQPGEIRDRGLVSPEFQIMDETSIIKVTGRLLASTIWSHNFKNDSDGRRIAIDIDKEMDLEPDRDALLDHLDLILLGGRMSPELRYEVNQLMDARDHTGAASQRVVEAIYLIVSSPEAALQL
ncbi:MAG: DUF1800 family protein [Granulosicoccus sp.]